MSTKDIITFPTDDANLKAQQLDILEKMENAIETGELREFIVVGINSQKDAKVWRTSIHHPLAAVGALHHVAGRIDKDQIES